MRDSDCRPRVCVLGSANTDLITRVERPPLPGETIRGSDFRTGFGGKGANQAVMAARLGAQVSMVARLGGDSFGESTLANFREQGIDTTHVSMIEGTSTGVAAITVDASSGQNSIVIVPGANDLLGSAEVDGAADAIVAADVLVCQLETPLEATLAAFRVARQGGTLTLLNPAPAAELPAELLELTDVLVPNEVEAAALSGLFVQSPEQAFAAGAALLLHGPASVAVTLGSRGVACIVSGQAPVLFPAEPVQAVDSTGAGDAFVGALAYLMGLGLNLLDAAGTACRIASRTVLRAGTQSSYPFRSEVEDVLLQR